jgi:hypothetical protein
VGEPLSLPGDRATPLYLFHTECKGRVTNSGYLERAKEPLSLSFWADARQEGRPAVYRVKVCPAATVQAVPFDPGSGASRGASR